MSILMWNQRITLDRTMKVSRNDSASISRAIEAGVEIWARRDGEPVWERVRAARSSNGLIQVRTERTEWARFKEFYVGVNPNLAGESDGTGDPSNIK